MLNMLIERGLPELTGEALILKHRVGFAPEIQAAAEKRLVEAGVDTSKLSGA